jgi:predicted AlkP superfamily phosphohydrolase/phosphomutase/tetratricopeptide (TPR) repeat protein
LKVSPRHRRKVLLVGWDAAEWKMIHPLLDRGEMPALARILHEGVSGRLASLRPMLSPMLWTSIATGRRADAHGVHGFTEIDPVTGGVRAASSLSRRTKAFWNILAQNGYTAQVIGWYVTHPAEPLPHDGVSVSDAFFTGAAGGAPPGHSVHPPDLQATLAALRVREEDVDASVVRQFMPFWEDQVARRDQRLVILRRELAECFSVHAVATYLLEHRPEADFVAVYHRVIDHLGHYFMPFHPPRLENVTAEDFAWYHEVMNGIYRLQDHLLARMLELAGDEINVLIVSDHGFYSDHLRPLRTPLVESGITAWHRPVGVLAACGPAFARDQLVHGASLLDITPTVLALFGLPAGADMEGRVLSEALHDPTGLPVPIASWEAVSGEDGQHPPGVHLDARESAALLEQFEAIGYAPAAGGTETADACRRENQWNLARALLDDERFRDALPLLEELRYGWPERMDFGLQLANCQLALGLAAEARATMAETLEGHEERPFAKLILGNIAYRERDFAGSLALLHEALALDSNLPGINNQLGLALIRHRAWEQAEAAFRRTLKVDADNAHAHIGVAHTLLRRRRFAEAADWALRALGLAFHLSLAHFTLGIALARLGENARAAEAFEACLRFSPGYLPAHRFLARVYRQTGDASWARFHRAAIERGESLWAVREREGARLRAESASRAAKRAENRRRQREQAVTASEHAPVTPVRAVVATDPSPLDLLIVSGLPRSGTSLMMQMLAAGGLPVLADEHRPADEHNPQGYLEWEPARRLAQEPALITAAAGKVVKVVSTLLPALPRGHRYRVIFMRRPIDAIAASQLRMRRRRQNGGDTTPDKADLARWLDKHLATTLEMVRHDPSAAMLEVDYDALRKRPEETLAAIVAFVGAKRLPFRDRMATVIRA